MARHRLNRYSRDERPARIFCAVINQLNPGQLLGLKCGGKSKRNLSRIHQGDSAELFAVSLFRTTDILFNNGSPD
jgi:hypothetical protein